MFKRKTVSSIMSVFTDTIDDLHKHAFKHGKKGDRLQNIFEKFQVFANYVSARLTLAKWAADMEAADARKAADRIKKALLSD